MSCADVCNPCAEGARCSDCGDRMCDLNGPEPRTCGTTCGDCPCDCECCLDEADDREMERLCQLERDERSAP